MHIYIYIYINICVYIYIYIYGITSRPYGPNCMGIDPLRNHGLWWCEILGDGIAVIVTIISIDNITSDVNLQNNNILHVFISYVENPTIQFDHLLGNKNVFFHIDVLVYWRLQKIFVLNRCKENMIGTCGSTVHT